VSSCENVWSPVIKRNGIHHWNRAVIVVGKNQDHSRRDHTSSSLSIFEKRGMSIQPTMVDAGLDRSLMMLNKLATQRSLHFRVEFADQSTLIGTNKPGSTGCEATDRGRPDTVHSGVPRCSARLRRWANTDRKRQKVRHTRTSPRQTPRNSQDPAHGAIANPGAAVLLRYLKETNSYGLRQRGYPMILIV
jgi:hypothetical protein